MSKEHSRAAEGKGIYESLLFQGNWKADVDLAGLMAAQLVRITD
jgi:hypothetical protein